ncbi:hypothetical protein ABG768_013268 [Culter alburnus]|uniref:DDE Tnp4 domain-containing protein n=1 Tax=Culter alburnus TaxID=194366 RepID=A0AAW2B659_CULAL
MEEIQGMLLLLMVYWFTKEIMNQTAENRRALIVKRIQKARNSRYKMRQRVLSAIADIDHEMAGTNARHRAERTRLFEKVLMPEVIKLPNSEKLKEMATYFERRWGLPQCVGAIDGSHIPILGPEDYHKEYFNRKGWHSIILQAVVDGRGLFWNVFVGAPGSLHDARVLRLSGLWGLVDRGLLLPDVTKNICGHDVGYFVLGDAAYPLKSWLMKPFTDNGQLTPQKLVYNQKTSRARVVVENAFGRLKGRWRCLLKRNDCSTHKVKSLVIACCVLHNLCEMNGDEFREEWVTSALNQPDGALSATVEAEGLDARTALMQFLTTA